MFLNGFYIAYFKLIVHGTHFSKDVYQYNWANIALRNIFCKMTLFLTWPILLEILIINSILKVSQGQYRYYTMI